MFKLIKTLFSKNSRPKYANCLNHRTWLERQVDNAIYLENNINQLGFATPINKSEEPEWYERYI